MVSKKGSRSSFIHFAVREIIIFLFLAVSSFIRVEAPSCDACGDLVAVILWTSQPILLQALATLVT